ncbi:MAG TPA: TonB-dependent receptor [Thermoanaerobaculia bacterium]|nr:TonB-dependent receptor [Thermoanaerobaculia bacterium]
MSRLALLFSFLLFLTTAPLSAQDSATTESSDSSETAAAEPDEEKTRTLPQFFESLMVVGGEAEAALVPGSAHYLGSEELQRHEYTDINRMLRQVPGVIIIEEEGYGLRPNIGMRGSGTERSAKITLLEDGILIAPAPYSAPAAYYFPTPGRMEAIEVRKGSSAIRQGPLTTGGALNLISTSIPYDFGGRFEAEIGTDSTYRAHASVGDSAGRFGWLIETYQLKTDGFKELDGGGGTGFDLRDYMGKLRWGSDSSAPVQQILELKLGMTEQGGDETYLGLSEQDFFANPTRRYRASASDRIDTEHEQIQLRHFIAPSANWDITTSVYRNDFFRNWHKLDSVGGVGAGAILADPELYSQQMAIIRGEANADGALTIRNNRRDYYGQGIQSVVGARSNFGGATHSLELGLRYHEDAEDRFQEDERWSMQGGRMSLFNMNAPGSNANRIGSAAALAFFVQDEIVFGRWSVTPGVRFESIDFTRRDYGRNDPARTGANLVEQTNSVEEWIPGIGMTFRATDRIALFTGVHRGFAPPGPGTSDETRPEESMNYEAGFRLTEAGTAAQVVGFFSDYQNLLGRDTLSSGGPGSGDLFNGGEVTVWGLEASVDHDFAPALRSSASIPLRIALTHTRGEFETSFETEFEDWAPQVDKGDELPYLPENQIAATIGYIVPRWSGHLTAAYTSSMRTVAGQGDFAPGTGTGSALTFDATAKIVIRPEMRLVLSGRNLSDEIYIAARRPAGLRPGLPRSFGLGIEWIF